MTEEANAQFNVLIKAKDETAKALEGIMARVRGLTVATVKLHKTSTSAFKEMYGHLEILHTRFGELRESVGRTGESFADLVPALAGLGAAATVSGLFEMVDHAAEAQASLSHMAEIIGINSQQLQRLDYAAKMSDTSTESLHTTLEHLNIVLAQGAKNKDAAALFKHLHIPESVKGKIADTTATFLKLADAFKNTNQPAMRNKMARVFGRAAQDAIPMLSEGSAPLKAKMVEAGVIGHVAEKPEQENLDKYHTSLLKVQAAVDGFKDTLSGQLAPVLQPIADDVTAWVAANRDWIASDITGSVQQLATWLKTIDFSQVIKDTKDWGRDVGDVFSDFGGLGTMIGAVALIMGTELLVKIKETTIALSEMGLGDVVVALASFAQALFLTRDAAFALDWALAANPLGVFIISVALAMFAGYELYEHWAWLKKQYHKLFEWFSHQDGWVQAIIKMVFPLFDLPNQIMNAWQPLKTFFEDLSATFQKLPGSSGHVMAPDPRSPILRCTEHVPAVSGAATGARLYLATGAIVRRRGRYHSNIVQSWQPAGRRCYCPGAGGYPPYRRPAWHADAGAQLGQRGRDQPVPRRRVRQSGLDLGIAMPKALAVPGEPAALTAAGCRAGRALLRWSRDDLATRAAVSRATIAQFEAGAVMPMRNNLAAMHAALLAGGVRFISDPAQGAGVYLPGPQD